MRIRLAFCLALLLIIASVAYGDTARDPRFLLLTEYRQMGWGESYVFGALDDSGNLWTLSVTSWQDIPFEPARLADWIENSGQLEPAGQISGSELRDILSLTETVTEQTVVCSPAANDAGIQTSYACRQSADDETQFIVLGISGDDMFENTDPGAQALYRFLRMNFPQVPSYDGEAGMAPAGFQAVNVAEFCGYKYEDLAGLTLTAYENDCEEGAISIEPDRSVREILQMQITGKKNSLFTTGNTVTYCLTDKEGRTIATFEFFGDLFVTSDGMYTVK